MIPIRYNLRSLTVRKRTSTAAALGIALVVFVFAGALMLSDGIKKTLAKTGKPDTAIVVRKGSQAELESGIEIDRIGLVTAGPGVRKTAEGTPDAVAEVVVVAAMDKIGTDGISNVQMRGVPENAMRFRPTVHIAEGRPMKLGADEAIIGTRLRGRFKGLELGQKFEIKKNRLVEVVGIFEDGGSSFESEVWADIELVRSAFHREAVASSVRLKLDSPSKFDAFKTALEGDKQLAVDVRTETDYYERQSSETSIFITAMGIIIAVFFSMGAMIGAMITMYAAVSNRQREIGTMRALGFSRFSILASFLFEAIVLAFVGGAFGTLASLGMSFVRFSMMNFVSWSEIVFSFTPTPGIILSALFFSMFMGVLGGFLPAVRAARMSPLQAIRD
jgi:putative ABC transport system permease protein